MSYITSIKLMKMGRQSKGNVEVRPSREAGKVLLTFTPEGTANDGKSPHSIVLLMDRKAMVALLDREGAPVAANDVE